MRKALIEAGLRHLEADGAGEISLRQLARESGVSAAAVYRHFPDKKALLAALAEEGFTRLGAAQEDAAAAAGGGPEGFAATGRAYVRFALRHPALFRLAFAHADSVFDVTAEDHLASRLLQEYARAYGGDRAPILALQAWSVAHGLAMLMLDGNVPRDEHIIEAVIDSATLFPVQGSKSEESP